MQREEIQTLVADKVNEAIRHFKELEFTVQLGLVSTKVENLVAGAAENDLIKETKLAEGLKHEQKKLLETLGERVKKMQRSKSDLELVVQGMSAELKVVQERLSQFADWRHLAERQYDVAYHTGGAKFKPRHRDCEHLDQQWSIIVHGQQLGEF